MARETFEPNQQQGPNTPTSDNQRIRGIPGKQNRARRCYASSSPHSPGVPAPEVADDSGIRGGQESAGKRGVGEDLENGFLAAMGFTDLPITAESTPADATPGVTVQRKKSPGRKVESQPFEASIGAANLSATMERSSGQHLSGAIASEMSSGVGVDASGVQVHTDDAADAAARMASARAMTSGNHIFFRNGEYDPASTSGKHLLAHELAHVKQQSEGRTAGLARKASDGDDTAKRDALEREADATADKVIAGDGDAGVGEIDWSKVDRKRLGEEAHDRGIKLGFSRDEQSGSAPPALRRLVASVFPEAIVKPTSSAEGSGVQLDVLEDWNVWPWPFSGRYASVKVSAIPDLIGDKADYQTTVERWAHPGGPISYDATIYQYIARRTPFQKAREWDGWIGTTTAITRDGLANAHWGEGAIYRHALGASDWQFHDIEAYADFRVLPLVSSAGFVSAKDVPDYSRAIPIQSSGNTEIEFSASTSNGLQQGYSVTNSRASSNFLASELTSSIGADVGVIAAKLESSMEAKQTIEQAISSNADLSSHVTEGSGFTIRIPATSGPVNKIAIPTYRVATLKLETRDSDEQGIYSEGSSIRYVHYIRPTGKYDLSDAEGKVDVTPADFPTAESKRSHDAQQANENAEFTPVSPGSLVHGVQRIGSLAAVRNQVDQVRVTADGMDEAGKTIELVSTESQNVTVTNGRRYTTSSSVTNEINTSIKSEIGLGEAASKATGITASVGGKISSGEALKTSIDQSISESTTRTATLSDTRTAQVPPFKKASLYLTPLARVTSYQVTLINGKSLYVHSYLHQPVRHSHVHVTPKRQMHPERWADA